MAVKVLIADDHDVIREGIKSILRNQAEYKVVGEAVDGEEVIRNTENLKPDIILLDITMPKKSGLDVIEQIRYLSPNTKVIMVTVHRANIYIAKALKLGVKGYLHKENVVEELLPALRNVSKGEVYMSPQVSRYMIEKVTREGKGPAEEILTEREADILRLIVEGKTAKEIAEVLFISRRTVENYKNNLLKKLGLHKTSELIKYAVQHKLIE
ncbi:MAG: response regulator transcription factor [Candidatus Omnitrophota bacterium]|nr:MAG: response regulator transcription factor [Candidatus Omnitrophota bacterium]